MKLGDARRLFTYNIARFIVWCFDNGFEVAGNELLRTQVQAMANAASGAGISNTLHLKGLALDLNLYLDSRPGIDDDIYQSDSAAYATLGQKWKSMHPLNRWGGDFKDKTGKPKPDGNHFSMEFEGVQ